MDNFETVSASEASTQGKPKKKDKKDKAEKDEASVTKKKLKIMKQALQDEKDSKDKLELEMEDLIKRIENLEAQNIEKDNRYQELVKEKINLEDSLLKVGK